MGLLWDGGDLGFWGWDGEKYYRDFLSSRDSPMVMILIDHTRFYINAPLNRIAKKSK